MQDKLIKFRKQVDWRSVRLALNSDAINVHYYQNFCTPKCRIKSNNRKEYLNLIHFLPKIFLDAYRSTGDIDLLLKRSESLLKVYEEGFYVVC